MSEPVTQSQEYREAFQYLKMSERTGLVETLTSFSQSLRKNGENLQHVFTRDFVQCVKYF